MAAPLMGSEDLSRSGSGGERSQESDDDERPDRGSLRPCRITGERRRAGSTGASDFEPDEVIPDRAASVLRLAFHEIRLRPRGAGPVHSEATRRRRRS